MVTDSGSSKERLKRFLEEQVWPDVPIEASPPWSKEEEEAALGFGDDGEPV